MQTRLSNYDFQRTRASRLSTTMANWSATVLATANLNAIMAMSCPLTTPTTVLNALPAPR